MFEQAMLVSAIIRDVKRAEDEADRRAFRGPDAPAAQEMSRRGRVSRLFRRPNVVN